MKNPALLKATAALNWRLEGPSFVWYFRGRPHVHVWVNVADNASPKLNAFQDSIMSRAALWGAFAFTLAERSAARLPGV